MKLRRLLPIFAALLTAVMILASCSDVVDDVIESTSGESSATEGESNKDTEKETDPKEESGSVGGETVERPDDGSAYYIIEAVANYGRNGLANGWKYDNRFDLTNIAGLDAGTLYDTSDEKFFRLIRDFEAESKGMLKLEMIVDAQGNEEGVYIAMCDKNDEKLFYMTPKNGVWVFVGENELVTEIPMVEAIATTKYAIEMNIDLDANTAELIINNVSCGSINIPDRAVERLILGTNKVGKGTIGFEYVRLIKNYPVVDRFILGDIANYEGQKPFNWDITGDFALARINSMRLYDMYSVKATAKAGSTSTAYRSFKKTSGVVSMEAMILLPEKVDGASVSFNCGDDAVITFVTRDGKIYVGDTMVNDYIPNVWQTLHVDADTNTGKAKIFVNGKLKTTVDFNADGFDGVNIGFAPDKDAVMWFDDVEIYEIIKAADYPEAPKVAESTDYNVGMNVCWLWRDQQSGEGWDATSPFSEFDPYLGLFDEGLRETADWELKWMAEHGIDFVHVCWYCPSADIQAPIKEMRHSYAALHDGYMMAEYSDLVDFCIMWENNAQDCYSFEQFRDYIWNYWCEYYFSDERYARLDNKAVISVWNRQNFEKTFGGHEQALEAMEWMEEEIKKYGYDGIVFLAQVQGQVTAEDYKQMASMGYDATYAYHWGNKGYDPQLQMKYNKGNIMMSKGTMHHIPTASIGFNDVGRNETRDPIITAEGHLKVLQEMKKQLGTFKTGTWKDNTVFLSTWNEFSEGTYMFPTESTGFAYLENVKNVFTNDTSDHSELDVRPTQSQIDRVTHLYPNNYSPIRWYQFEKADYKTPEYLINVNGYEMKFTFNPQKTDDGDYIAVGEAKGKGFYSMLRVFYEWDRFTGDGVLTLHTYTEHTYVFKVGSDKVIVDGVEKALGFTFTLRDGLPQFHMKKLCDVLGYKYVEKDNTLFIQVCTDEEYENLMNKVENSWDFNMPGELEGWAIQQGSAVVEKEGTLKVTPSGNDIAIKHSVEFAANRYTVIKVGIKYNASFMNQQGLLYFTTKSSSEYSGDKMIVGKYDIEGKQEGEIVELIFNLADSANFVGTITGMRIDPFTGTTPFEVDYVYCLYDEEYALENNVVEKDDENQWYFDTEGNSEGWEAQNATISGVAGGTITVKPSNSDPSIVKNVNFRATKYHVMIAALKYTTALDGQTPELFVLSGDMTNWSSDSNIKGIYRIPEGVKEGDIVYAVFNLQDSAAWKGTVKALRFDPISASSTIEIDYIRFYQRKGQEMTGKPATKPTEAVVSGPDAIPEGIVIQAGGKAQLLTVTDPTDSTKKVFKIECTSTAADNKNYTYFNLFMHFEPGETYNITYKIMVLTDANGASITNGTIGGSIRYGTTEAAFADHAFNQEANKSTTGKWVEVTVQRSIPSTYSASDADCFQIWAKFSPTSGVGISYLVKDISITLAN